MTDSERIAALEQFVAIEARRSANTQTALVDIIESLARHQLLAQDDVGRLRRTLTAGLPLRGDDLRAALAANPPGLPTRLAAKPPGD